MEYLAIGACSLIGIFLGIQLLSLIAIFIKNKTVDYKHSEYPMISVLLAARNEQETIERCLTALSKLDYPEDKIEILIGNDDSSDQTHCIAEKFISSHHNFKLYLVQNNLGKAIGKANVLAHLAHEAKGEYFFITDCDVAVDTEWIKSLLACFNEKVGIASGTTICYGKTLNAHLQSMDWLHFMGYIKALANLGISCTSVGNNMAVRAKAYWQTGGYENIDFSITEDYKLFKEITVKGWQWQNILNTESLGLATPINDISEFLHQRKRWLMGARELPVLWKTMLVIYGLFIPSLLILFLINPFVAINLFIVKFMIQSVFIHALHLKINSTPRYWPFLYPVYELYLVSVTQLTAIFYILPIPSVWKERTYKINGLKN